MSNRAKLEMAIAYANIPEDRGLVSISAVHLSTLRDAACLHLSTLPKVTFRQVWHVEFCNDGIPFVTVVGDAVIAHARAMAYRDKGFACIHVTGPHQQGVPA
jgi:hypothetical protein